MKKILVAVDFSDNANEAAHYAVQFGKSIGINDFIFHNSFLLNTIDIVSVDPMQQIHIAQMQKEANMEFDAETVKASAHVKLARLVAELQHLYGAMHADINIESGDLVDNIESIVEDEPIVYVVMGITGRNTLGQKLIGSNTMKVIQEVEIPVIVVPSGVSFSPIHEIALAMPIPRLEKIDYPWVLMRNTLKQIDAHLNVVSVSKTISEPDMRTLINENTVLNKLNDISTTVFYYADKSITDGLLAFSERLNVQMIATVAGEHTLIGKLFKPSVTEKLAYKTNIPLLVFKED